MLFFDCPDHRHPALRLRLRDFISLAASRSAAFASPRIEIIATIRGWPWPDPWEFSYQSRRSGAAVKRRATALR
ncbi:hypothetical protein V5799_029286 [Amblyomma americanum]|uniref:Uncharacterized protein n=1 Tax=Amblyomma americanum TaxID=6943 RepID=A0AAQ4ERT6_AMBAM